jgi:hypothetical protein
MCAMHASVDDVLRNFLGEVDREAPELVEGFYLTGSLALGDFRPGRSDLDFVGIVAPAQADVLHQASARHRRQYPTPRLDGIFLSWRDLAEGPDALIGLRPTIQNGVFSMSEGGGARTPVTWHILAEKGLGHRGPALAETALWNDAGRLAAWVRDNLDLYWTPFIERHGRLASGPGLRALGPWFTAWSVLGICRLHATLATGGIVSKTEAGCLGLDSFATRWHPIIEEALSIHRGARSIYRDPFGRRRDCLDFVRMAIAASKELPR